MTLNQFFRELRKHRGKFYNINGLIRTKSRPSNVPGYITRPLCPIEEVYRARSKKAYRNPFVDHTGAKLGLSEAAVVAIIYAADCDNGRYRKTMLKVLGL